MHQMARWEKVSFEQFAADWQKYMTDYPRTEEELRAVYDAVKLPVRATSGSAGYDITAPVTITLKPGESLRVPTGLRVWMEEGWVLMIFPRSGMGYRYRLQMDNTAGIVDADYYGADNEGHILTQVSIDTREDKTLTVPAGTGFVQGLFMPFGVTVDDAAEGIRRGGFGSTTPEGK